MADAKKRLREEGSPEELLARSIEVAVRDFIGCDPIYRALFCFAPGGRVPICWGSHQERYAQLWGCSQEVTIPRLLALCADLHNRRVYGGYELQVLGNAMEKLGIQARTKILTQAETECRTFVDSRWWSIYKNLVLLGWCFVQVGDNGLPKLGDSDELKRTLLERWDAVTASPVFTALP